MASSALPRLQATPELLPATRVATRDEREDGQAYSAVASIVTLSAPSPASFSFPHSTADHARS